MNEARRSWLSGMLAGVVALLCPWRSSEALGRHKVIGQWETEPDSVRSHEVTPRYFTTPSGLKDNCQRISGELRGQFITLRYSQELETHPCGVVGGQVTASLHCVGDSKPCAVCFVQPGETVPWRRLEDQLWASWDPRRQPIYPVVVRELELMRQALQQLGR